MSENAYSYDAIAADAFRRQQLRTMEAERHQYAANVAQGRVREADARIRQANNNRRTLFEEERTLHSTVDDLTRDFPWLMEDYKEFTDVVPFTEMDNNNNKNNNNNNNNNNKNETGKKTTKEEATKEEEKQIESETTTLENKEETKSEDVKADDVATKATAPVAEETAVPIAVNDSMSLTDRARILFQERESAMDGCVS